MYLLIDVQQNLLDYLVDYVFCMQYNWENERKGSLVFFCLLCAK